jgi:hypothetical protein
MWRVFLCLLAVAYVDAQEIDEPEEGAVLESVLDDEEGRGKFRARWRVRGWDGMQWYQRGEWQRKNEQAFVLVERDAGEAWSDFSALYYRRTGRLGEMVVGDVRASFAGGLVFGRGRSGGMRLSLRDSQQLGYRSSVENGAVRGMAWRHEEGRWQWALLGGRAALDARIDASGHVISLPESGQHVSETERTGRDLLAMTVGGIRLRRSVQGGHVGLVLQGIDFSRHLDLRRKGRTPWGFVGGRQFMGSVDGAWVGGGYALAMEIGRDRGEGWVGLVQMKKRWQRARMRLMGRYYPSSFHSFFGAAPGAGSMQNERGVTVVLDGKAGAWQVYLDAYRRPQRTFFLPVAAGYGRWGGHWHWRLKRWQGRFLWQGRSRPRWSAGRLWQDRTRRGRLDIERGIWVIQGQSLRLWKAGGGDEWGGVLALRGRWQQPWGHFVLHGSLFAVDSYASRLYEYEYDLPGAVSIRPLYGDGWRLYMLIARRWRGIEIALRYRLQRAGDTRHYAGVLVDVVSLD